MTTEDAELIRAANIKLAEQALEINCVQQAQHAILALLCWGTSSDHCPQRRSGFRLLKWKHVSVSEDGAAVLQFGSSAKTGTSADICIAETNPMLSQLLVALKPLAQEDMHLISDRELGRSTINDRLQSIYKNAGLEDRLLEISRLQYSVLRNFIVPATDWYGKHYETVRTILLHVRTTTSRESSRVEANARISGALTWRDGGRKGSATLASRVAPQTLLPPTLFVLPPSQPERGAD
eukprot:COSAG02_NODE_265_length_26599_cov_13.943698_6_plen_237_part_00